MTFKGWIAHIGSERNAQYVLCARKPTITCRVDLTSGTPVLVWDTSTMFFQAYCRAGFETLMRAKVPLGGIARMTYTLDAESIEVPEPQPGAWADVTDENYDEAIPPRAE